MISSEDLVKELRKTKLLYISDKRNGIMRQKVGKGFKFYDSQGQKVTSRKTLSRIERLVIPPAWENVWICNSPRGYLQVTGYDEKGRKQYLYHQAWIEACQQDKFDKMLFFANVLPKIRRKVRADMQEKGLTKKRVVATVVWLLEHTLIRVGNEEYAKDNHSFGLTTLHNKHVNVKGSTITFQFMGKSGVAHDVDISSPIVSKTIKKCIELPGFELFQYLDDDKQKHTIDSADVNEYLKEITGEEITAKDFRTWGGTVLSAVTLDQIGPFKTKTEAKNNIRIAVKKVAQHLRNTTTVCRNYYIHPAILGSYNQEQLVPNFDRLASSLKKLKGLTSAEYATLKLLEKFG